LKDLILVVSQIPFAAIFGYVVGNIGEHILEKILSILIARSSGTRLWTGGYVAGWNWQADEMELRWTVWDENERKIAWELVCDGRGCPCLLLSAKGGRERAWINMNYL
jgi:hypothetical protein